MHVCIYDTIYIFIYACTYVHIYVCTVCMYVCMYVYMYLCMYFCLLSSSLLVNVSMYHWIIVYRLAGVHFPKWYIHVRFGLCDSWGWQLQRDEMMQLLWNKECSIIMDKAYVLVDGIYFSLICMKSSFRCSYDTPWPNYYKLLCKRPQETSLLGNFSSLCTRLKTDFKMVGWYWLRVTINIILGLLLIVIM